MTLQFTIDAQELRQSLKVIKPFIPADTDRYYLNGVFFYWTGSQMLLAATDGHRLIERKLRGITHAGGSAGGAFRAIFPQPLLEALDCLLKASGRVPVTLEMTPVKADSSHLRFQFSSTDNDLTVTSIDGTYPDYPRVFPEKKNSRNAFNAKYVYDALAAFVDDGQKGSLSDLVIDIHYDGDSDGASPQLLSASGDSDTLVVLMPRRVV